MQRLRFWLRRAPLGQRCTAGAAIASVFALLTWSVVPDGGTTEVTAGLDPAAVALGSVGGPSGSLPGVTGPVAVDLGPEGSVTGGPIAGDGGARPPTGPAGTDPASTASSDPGGCTSPAGAGRGVDGDHIRVAVGLTNIVGPAANSVLGLPTAARQREMFDAVIDGINREGGVACRQLAADYYEANPADETQMNRICLDVVDSDVFAMIDTGALSSRPGVLDCFGRERIPFFTGYAITEFQRRLHYPYLYGFYARESLYEHTVSGLRDRGFFEPAHGFEKLGWLVKTCQREAIDQYRSLLAEIGITGDRLVEYQIGCPSAFASPSDLQQAVLTFRTEGVTHVLTADIQGDLAVFTNTAESQGFRPVYAFPDESVISLSYGVQRPNPDNIDGAVAITTGRQGEERTPGVIPTAGTERCNDYYRAAGLPTVYEQHSIAGNTCDELWMFREGLNRAPEFSAPGLQIGLQASTSIDFSYPQGPNDFSAPGSTTGGQFRRAAVFVRSCECWQLAESDFERAWR